MQNKNHELELRYERARNKAKQFASVSQTALESNKEIINKLIFEKQQLEATANSLNNVFKISLQFYF